MCAAERYRNAGVSIAAGGAASARALSAAAKTHGALAAHGARMLDCAGGFAAAATMPGGGKVLLTAADGVGTKVELARACGMPEVIGRDVVAMCANDILCAGGYPFLFLDYYACGKLNADFAAKVIDGIAAACVESGCALVGGETAEMPGVYEGEKMDVAGFAVGVAEEKELFNTSNINAGDVILALPSSGAHSNGYALINRILQTTKPDEQTMAELLKPTRLYCGIIRKLRAKVKVKALAHITGGGVVGNIARLLPSGLQAVVDARSFSRPPLFEFLREAGDIGEDEMWRVFNCGVGMAIVTASENESRALEVLKANNEAAWKLGVVGDDGDDGVLIKGI